jgi:hypothetical protein
MRVKLLFVVLVLAVVGWSSPGRAESGEKATLNQGTKLYTRAGEQSPVIFKLETGTVVKVLKKDGRWLNVRAKGRTGWVPRSTVDLPEADDEEIARNTRRRPFVDGRGTRRGFGGERGPDDRIGADALGEGDEGDAGARPSKPARPVKASDDDVVVDDDGDDDSSGGDAGDDDAKAPAQPIAHVAKRTSILNDPSLDSDESFVAEPKTPLLIGETTGEWTFVQTEEGDAGYVQSAKLDLDEPAPGGRARMLSARGRLGVTSVSQSLETPGAAATIPENYSAGGTTITLAIGGSVLYPYSKRYWIGGDFTYDFNKSLGSIKYMAGAVGFTYHSLNLRAVGGYDLQTKNGMIVLGRLGLHYDSFQISDVADFTKNTAKLPNQIITSPTIGVALAIPRLTKLLGLTVGLDITVFGASVSQTKNLEDGTGPSAKAAYLGSVLTYRWKPKMDLQASYDLGYTSVSFSGMPPATSQRGHTGTATRSGSGLSNALSVGMAYAF